MLISSWINKLWHDHRMECHSVTNLNEALRDTTTQLSQKPVTKTVYAVSPFMFNVENKQMDRKQFSSCLGL